MHGPYNILPADGTFTHPLATLGAGHHVATLKENTVDGCIHTDPAKVVIGDPQMSLFTSCKEEMQAAVKNEQFQSAPWCPDEGIHISTSKVFL